MPLYRIFYLVFLLCGLPQLTGAQQLNGVYCFDGGFDNRCIRFGTGNRFGYSYTGCLGGEVGWGDYTIDSGYLVLQFKNDTVPRPLVAWTVVDSSETASDSVLWQFVIVDPAGEFISGAIIRAKDRDVGAVTNMDGKAELVVPKASSSLGVTVHSIGIGAGTYPIVLSQDKAYMVKAVIRADDNIQMARAGTTKRFRIGKITAKRIELMSDYEEARFEVYRKMKIIKR